MRMQSFLQVAEIGAGGSRSSVYALPIRRETSNFYETAEGFAYGIVGLTAAQRNKKVVQWCKTTHRRRGDEECHYTHTFEVQKVVPEGEISSAAIRI